MIVEALCGDAHSGLSPVLNVKDASLFTCEALESIMLLGTSEDPGGPTLSLTRGE